MTTTSIFFVDSRVADFQSLFAGLPEGAEWYLLNADEDGVDQMARILSGHSSLDSIHIVSHGSTGTLYLGSTVLNTESLFSYENQLQAIGASLTETGDILLYGCNVAQGDAGTSFINNFAEITGGDVAASDGPTGAGGNWELEHISGRIESNSISGGVYAMTLADDYANTTSTTGTISVGGTATGNIETVGDTDWFKTTLTYGHTYRFDLEGSATGRGTLADPYMSLRSSNGSTKLIENDNDGTGYNSQFSYLITTTGTYFVAAGAGWSIDGTGTYRVSITDITPAVSLPDLDARNGDDGSSSYAASLNISSVTAGSSVTLTYRATNWGPGSAPSSITGIYRSTDSTITTSDIRITTDSVSSLASGTGLTETVTISTTGWTPGTYYIGAVADYNNSITEGDESNNASNGVVLTVAAPVTLPDLDARNGDDGSSSYAASLNISSVTAGSSVTLTYRATNWGPGSAPSSITGIYRSTDSTITTSDIRITTDSVSSLASGTGLTETVTISTTGWTPGTYYIGAVADYNNSITEGDESNNASNGVVLTVTAPAQTNTWTKPVAIVNYPVSPISVLQGYGGETTHDYLRSNGSGNSIRYAIDFDVPNDVAINPVSVKAISNGTIISARTGSDWDDADYGQLGNFVTVLHDDGYYATYAHLSSVTMISGRVLANEVIGVAGNTGNFATSSNSGHHLHIHFGLDITNVDANGQSWSKYWASGSNNPIAPVFFSSFFSSSDETAGLVDVNDPFTILATDIFGTATANDDTYPDPDRLIGTSLNNRIFAGSGHDKLFGLSGDDILIGGTGNDSMYGGAGNDTYYVRDLGDKVDETNTTLGADSSILNNITNAGGTDLVLSSVTFDLSAYTGVSFVENLRLNSANSINGTGNSLNNTIYSGAGNNVINGLGGTDTVSYAYATAGVTVNLTLATAQNTGGAGTDTLTGIENLTGSAYADTLTGAAGANVMRGGAGRDILNGLGGKDTLTGNGGNDVFVLGHPTASDTITDFLSGADDIRIRMSAIRIGDGDTLVEGGVTRAAPNGFAASAELVIFTANIAGAITTTSAAAAIGSAGSAYTAGDKRLFAVDNGTSSALFLFTAADANASVTAAELTQLASLSSTAGTGLGDYVFGA